MSEALVPAVSRYERELGLLPEGDRAAFEAQLWTVLAAQAERYTMGESSSLPEETVQELLRSVCFCVGLRLKSGRALSSAPLSELFEEGQRQAWALAQRGKSMLEVVLREALPVDNWSYRDTLQALPEFFPALRLPVLRPPGSLHDRLPALRAAARRAGGGGVYPGLSAAAAHRKPGLQAGAAGHAAPPAAGADAGL